MPKYKLRVGRFPYGMTEATECVDWLIRVSARLSHDKRFEVSHARIADTPITMTRNRMFLDAAKDEIDLLLIVDSDMAPDVELGCEPGAKPFLDSSLEFMLTHEGPCVIAAPYCGPPPHENVYVFQWANYQGDHPDADWRIVQYTREQAAVMAGMHQAAALPTGLMLIDMRGLKKLPPDKPPTYYEWTDGWETNKASTEDCTFSRDLAFAGVPLYCNWDAWAGHVKRKVVRKPRPVTTDAVAEAIRPAILARRSGGDRLVDVGGTRFQADIDEAIKDVRSRSFIAPNGRHAVPVPMEEFEKVIDQLADEALDILDRNRIEAALVDAAKPMLGSPVQTFTIDDVFNHTD